MTEYCHGTDDYRGWTLKQVEAKYRQVRAFVLALPNNKFLDAAQFDEFVSRYNPGHGMRDAKGRLLGAFGQLSHHLTVTTYVPPSPETLAWGGFLGGEHYHNRAAADAAYARMMETAP